jgi:nucleotide-binding universal stress UspA family protein
MLHRIVWACDGRAGDGEEFEYVDRLCRAYRSTLWLAHVAPGDAFDRSATVASDGDAFDPSATVASDGDDPEISRLKSRTRSLREGGIDASLHVIRGPVESPAAAIAALVRDVDADLLVIGGDRERRPGSPPGPTATSLLATAGCPVLWLGDQRTPSVDS